MQTEKNIKDFLRKYFVEGLGWFPFVVIQSQKSLLYLPTQIRFPIGGERVTCHGSNFTNSLGRTKLTNSLGKQQLELLTRT